MKISLGKVTEDGSLSAPTSTRRKAILGAGGLLLRLSLFLTQRLASPPFTTGILPPPKGKWVASPEVEYIIKMKGLEQEEHQVMLAFLTTSTLLQPCQEGAERDMNASATARSYRFRAEGS